MNAQGGLRSFSPSPDFVRAVLKGHSGLGLAFAAAIYLVCLSGTLAVFVNEFIRWENPSAPRLQQVSAEAVNRAYRDALARGGAGVEHVWITLPRADMPVLQVTTETGEAQGHLRQSWIADAQGRLVAPLRNGWSEFLSGLHVRLHLPRQWGLFLVGLTGVALLSSLISGILAHPRIFRDAFHLRLGGSRRLQEADLHNRIGVWALPFHVIVSLTGALLGLSVLIVGVLGLALFQGDTAKVYDLFLPAHPADDPRPAPPLQLTAMFAQVSARAPDGRIEYVFLEHPLEMGGAAMFNVRGHPDRVMGVDSFIFDRDGKLFKADTVDGLNLGQKILNSLAPLHFGWFGGWLVKLAYGVLGLGLTYLAAGGVLIWLVRRRDKGRPAPALERLWAATLWGQPAALAIAALVLLLAPAAPPSLGIGVWALASLLMFAGVWLPDARTVSRLGRLLTGGLLALLPVVHLLTRRNEDPVALLVNAALLLGGCILLLPLVRERGLIRRR